MATVRSDGSKVGAASIKVALAGNPNVGKTSLFNVITGSNRHVGNYPGVTVEKRLGTRRQGDRVFDVLDLPGTYNLSSYSPEERIAQDEILKGGHDVVVVVADSTVLKRSLVLMVHVMLTGAKTVLCLNMADEARSSGQQVDLEAMRKLLGFPVVETVASRGEGIEELLEAIAEVHAQPRTPHRLVLGNRLDAALAELKDRLRLTPIPEGHEGWVATRLLIGDPEIWEDMADEPGGSDAIAAARELKESIQAATRMDISLFLTHSFFGFVDGLLKEVVTVQQRRDLRVVSDRIDSVFVHRVWGLPIFALVMYAIFWLTFTAGAPPMDWIDAGVQWLAATVTSLWPDDSSMMRSLVVDGIIGGVGGVLVFLPNIVLLFVGLAFLEDTGYMARAAFLMDNVMHRFGLHGKSFLPLITGFGCTIPAIMATRTLENERDRLTTILVLPLMSCGARLTIWMLLIPAFFPAAWRAPVLWGIYFVGVVTALVLALILRKTVLKGDDAPFVMELPPYRLPTLRAVWLKMLERAWMYVRKAGTVILGISIILWFLTAFPLPSRYQVDLDIESGVLTEISQEEIESRRAAEGLAHSVAGRIGRGLEPVFAPLGFDWKTVTAMVGAFAAKEVFVSQLAIVYSMAGEEEDSENLRGALGRDYSPIAGISMILFLLIATPCMATFAITRKETGHVKWAVLQFFGLTAIAYLVALVVFQVGSLLL